MKLDIQLFAASTTITKTIKDSYNNSYTVTATINESLPSDYITTNKTLLSGTVTVSNTGDGGAYTSSKSMSATLTFRKNNSSGEVLTSATGSCKFDFRGSSTVTVTPLPYNNLEINHETDGTRTVYAYLEIKISETSLKQTQHYDTTLPLTTIPRASSLTISGNKYLNSTLTLTITRASNSFTHKLYYSFGSLSNQTSGLSPYVLNASTTSATFTPPLSLANQIPLSPVGSCTLTCVTYKNSTQTDENKVGSKSYSFQLQVASSQMPSSSIGTLSEADSTMSSLNWKKDNKPVFIVGKSKISFPVTVSPSYSSPTTLKVTVNDETYNENAVTTSTTTNYTTGYLTTVGENTISAKVEDRRQKSYTKNATYTVYDYTSPEITEFDVVRCNSGGTASDEGTYIKYKFSASIDAVYDGTNNHNAHSFALKFRVKGSSGSYTPITTQSGTLSNNKYTATVPYTTYGSSTTTATNYFSPNSAYEFVLEVTDSFRTSNNPVKQTKYIETGFDLLNFNSNGKAMAIGKVSEATGTNKLLEIALPIKATESLNAPIFRNSGGNWWKARDNATVKQTKVTETEGSSWNPVASVKTATGDWSIGNVGGERLVFAYVPDTSYSGQTNTDVTYYYLNNSGEFTGKASNVTQKKSLSSKSHSNYGTNNGYVPDMSFIAYWNGAYSSGNASNLTYSANGQIIGSNHFPVGSVVITSTNTQPTLPGSWTLIDKEFSSATGTTGYTRNTTNCTAVGTFNWARAGHSITLTVNFTNKVQIKDDALTMFTIDFATLGITQLASGYFGQTYSDKAKCAAFISINATSGAFQTVEVIPDNYISADRDDNRGTFTFVIPKDYMLDNACDKFYWKRDS